MVTLYMFKWFNNQMRPKLQRLKPGSRIVAHDFDIDEWKPTKIEYVNPGDDNSAEFSEPRTLYLWKVEPGPRDHGADVRRFVAFRSPRNRNFNLERSSFQTTDRSMGMWKTRDSYRMCRAPGERDVDRKHCQVRR